MAYTYDPIFAVDPANSANIAKNATITIFDPADPSQAPIAITDPTGSPMPNPITVDAAGMEGAFQHPTLARVGWKGAGFVGYFTSYEGMLNETIAAKDAAQTAVSAAEAAAATAEAAAQAPTDEQVEAGIERANIPAVVAAAVAADPAPAAAAANAVTTAMNNQYLSWTLTEGYYPTAHTLPTTTTYGGTPAYTAAGKFGNALSGGTLSMAGLLPKPLSVPLTYEGWFYLASAPGATKVLSSFGTAASGSGLWIGVDGPGQVIVSPSGGTTVATGKNIADAAWHHIAIELTNNAGGQNVISGFWVDGTPYTITNSTASIGWTNNGYIGGLGSTSAYNWPGRVDEVRASSGSRYAGTFTPPTAAFAWDDKALFIAHLESATATKLGTFSYPVRPAGARNGAVTYVGSAQPVDWATNDRWITV